MKLSDQNQDYGNKQYCNNCSYGIPPVIGFLLVIFNLETTTVSPRGREFLNYAQKNGAVVSFSDDLPQCYVLADAPVDTVYLSELSSAAMKRRTEMPF